MSEVVRRRIFRVYSDVSDFILKGNGNRKKYVETPLMKQYYAVKAVHPDAILLFRVGDFYETFGDDAIKASGILGITLTRRANGAATFVEPGRVSLSCDRHLPTQAGPSGRTRGDLRTGSRIPNRSKGWSSGASSSLVTPGVVLGDNILANKENTYLAAVYFGRKNTGVAFLDISTGEFYAAEGSDAYIDKLISNLAPKEIIYQRGYEDRFSDAFGSRHYTYRLDEWVFSESVNRDKALQAVRHSVAQGLWYRTVQQRHFGGRGHSLLPRIYRT